MIEIVQPGQVGKTNLLFGMHRLRARVFKGRMDWNVIVDPDGLEVDQFDIPDALYLLALDENGLVVGNWRILSLAGPTMIRDVWPRSLNSLPMPWTSSAWEVSRFAVSAVTGQGREGLRQVNRATQEMFCALTELCILCGIEFIYTLYDERIARLIKRLNCTPYQLSDPFLIDGIPVQTGCFKTDQKMLDQIRSATGISESFVSLNNLPPKILQNLAMYQEVRYVS